MPNAKQIFQQILSAPPAQAVAVFDLDSTLFDVSHRTQAILQAFLNQPDVQKHHPNEHAFLQNVKIASQDWGLRQPLERLGFQSTPDFQKRLRDYWRQHFFSSLYLHIDQPYPGAREYVQSLHQKGADIYYLTGRDSLNMRAGTLASLQQWHLPLPAESHLIMKPQKGSLEDDLYKELEMHKLFATLNQKHGPNIKVWFFENEPLILNRIRTATPQVNLIWIDSTHSGRAPVPLDLPMIRAPWEY